jgi:hypothetical protein
VPFLLGRVVLGLFVLVDATLADPLVPLQFFRNRTRVATNVTTLFFSSTFFVGFSLLMLYLEEIQHWSAMKTGLAYLPFGLAIGVGIGLGSGLVTKLGIKPLMLTGFVLVGIAVLLFARITVASDYPGTVLPAMLVFWLASTPYDTRPARFLSNPHRPRALGEPPVGADLPDRLANVQRGCQQQLSHPVGGSPHSTGTFYVARLLSISSPRYIPPRLGILVQLARA